MFYSQVYYDTTVIAADIIRQSSITSFPINPVKLAKAFDIRVITYETFSKFIGLSMGSIAGVSSDGFSVLIDGQYFIAYNPHATPKTRRRWTLIHEISHIKLGHVRQRRNNLPVYPLNAPMESDANELTCCLIAPLPVALLCNINSELQFASCFGLSNQATINLYGDYSRYRMKSMPPEMGYGSSLDNFRAFVLEYNRLMHKARNRLSYVNLNIYKDETLSG